MAGNSWDEYKKSRNRVSVLNQQMPSALSGSKPLPAILSPFAGKQPKSADVKRESSPGGTVPKVLEGYRGGPTPRQADFANDRAMGIQTEGMIIPPTQKSAMEKFQEFLATIDPGEYNYENAVRDAFAKSYTALDNAANTARGNKAKSAEMIGGLAQGGANNVRQNSQAIQSNTDRANSTLGMVSGGQVNRLQDDRSKELAERAQFIEKLGIKDAGLGTAGSTQTNAIAEAAAAGARNQAQMTQYGSADQSLNNDRVAAILNEGTTRQADLERQLMSIMGNIDSKRADIAGQEGQAIAQAKQQAYQDKLNKFMAGQKAYESEINRQGDSEDRDLRRMEIMARMQRAQAGNNPQTLSPAPYQAADSYVEAQGEDVDAYRNFMTSFMTDLAKEEQVRGNMASPEFIRGKMLQAADGTGLNPTILYGMWQIENKAPVKYMEQ